MLDRKDYTIISLRGIAIILGRAQYNSGFVLTVLIMISHGPKTASEVELEQSVRSAVYNKSSQVESPNRDFRDILIVPQPLADSYKKDPKAVLELLLKIIDGANPPESALAAGYAIELLSGPGVGVICVEYFDKAKYDALDKDWKTTIRNHWMGKILAKIKGE